MRTLSTTKSSSDDNHWEKLCKVLRVSDGILDTKRDYFESEITPFYGMLKLKTKFIKKQSVLSELKGNYTDNQARSLIIAIQPTNLICKLSTISTKMVPFV